MNMRRESSFNLLVPFSLNESGAYTLEMDLYFTFMKKKLCLHIRNCCSTCISRGKRCIHIRN